MDAISAIDDALAATPALPFQTGDIDYARPINIKTGPLRNSRIIETYIALFVCFVTKAIHLKVVSDLSTKALLAAIDRFVSRRGLPTDIYSDHGSNFLGAKNTLTKL
jgi:hypothetical protein